MPWAVLWLPPLVVLPRVDGTARESRALLLRRLLVVVGPRWRWVEDIFVAVFAASCLSEGCFDGSRIRSEWMAVKAGGGGDASASASTPLVLSNERAEDAVLECERLLCLVELPFSFLEKVEDVVVVGLREAVGCGPSCCSSGKKRRRRERVEFVRVVFGLVVVVGWRLWLWLGTVYLVSYPTACAPGWSAPEEELVP